MIEWLDELTCARERTVFDGLSQGANVAYAVSLGPRYPALQAVINRQG